MSDGILVKNYYLIYLSIMNESPGYRLLLPMNEYYYIHDIYRFIPIGKVKRIIDDPLSKTFFSFLMS